MLLQAQNEQIARGCRLRQRRDDIRRRGHFRFRFAVGFLARKAQEPLCNDMLFALARLFAHDLHETRISIASSIETSKQAGPQVVVTATTTDRNDDIHVRCRSPFRFRAQQYDIALHFIE